MNSFMNGKIESLQILRALAAILVVFNHLWGDSKTELSTLLGLHFVGGFGVDAFFVLSGFIMCYTTREDVKGGYKDAATFLLRRIERIYPIFIIVLLPFAFKYTYSTGEINASLLLGNALLLPSFTNNPSYFMLVAPAWTLVYEMMFYFIYSASILFSNNKSKIIIISSVSIVFVVVMINVLSLQGERLEWVNFSYMIGDPLMINFVMGCIYAVVFKRLNRERCSVYIVAPLILISFLIGMWASKNGFPRFVSFGIPAFIIVVLFSLMKQSGNACYRMLVYVGNASYSIYLTHFLFVPVRTYILKKYDINNDQFGVIMSLVAILFGCIFYSIIERKISSKIKEISFLRQRSISS